MQQLVAAASATQLNVVTLHLLAHTTIDAVLLRDNVTVAMCKNSI
jgi:hypothetical protein